MHIKKAVVMGSGKIAAGCLNILADLTEDVSVIETENQTLSCVRMISGKLRLPYNRMDEYQRITAYLESMEEDTLIVSANNNYLFPRSILSKRNFHVVNFHNALLPAYPGRNAPTWVIFNDEKTTGVTWHMVGEGVDTGDILVQTAVPVGSGMTALELTRLCMDEGIRAFSSISAKLLQCDVDCQMQDLSKRGKLHRSWESPNQGVLDIAWPLEKMYSILRSLDYGGVPVLPVPLVVWEGETYQIRKYRMTSAVPGMSGLSFRPGELLIQEGQRLIHMELERRMEYEPCGIHLAGTQA